LPQDPQGFGDIVTVVESVVGGAGAGEAERLPEVAAMVTVVGYAEVFADQSTNVPK